MIVERSFFQVISDRWEGSMQLDSLPAVLIEEVLLHLKHPKDIINFASSSRQFKDVALSDMFWLRVLLGRWGDRTQPSDWLTERPMGHFELFDGKHRFPGSYRWLEDKSKSNSR